MPVRVTTTAPRMRLTARGRMARQLLGLALAVVVVLLTPRHGGYTAALDPETVGDVLAIMRQLARDGMTMLVVTHEMGFAREVADRVVFMDGGVVVEAGPAAAVISDPQQPRTQDFLRRVLHPTEIDL